MSTFLVILLLFFYSERIPSIRLSLPTPTSLSIPVLIPTVIDDSEQGQQQPEGEEGQDQTEAYRDTDEKNEFPHTVTTLTQVNYLTCRNMQLQAEKKQLKCEWSMAMKENWMLHDRIKNFEEAYEDRIQKLIEAVALLQTVVVGGVCEKKKRNGCLNCRCGVQEKCGHEKQVAANAESVEGNVKLEEEEGEDEWVLANEDCGETGVGESEA
jgi:hypothetical protein